jgi:ATP-dependent protease HslVU (ClpYQ) peptidase subunit
MKNVTLNNGTVMTDAEFVQQRSGGDTLTSFVGTKADLVSLANQLVDELLADEFFLLLQTSRSEWNRRDYRSFRLSRVMEFLPELDAEIQEKLRIGRKKNEEVAAKELAKAG